MPLTLVAPKPGRTPNYHIRGTHLGVAVNRSAGTPEKRIAAKIKRRIEDEIERGAYALEQPANVPITFLAAAVAYMRAGGERAFLGQIIEHTGEHAIRDKPIDAIVQLDVDNLADVLYPNASAQTRNRQVYTPVAAVLHRAGIERKFKRPKGWRGSKATSWLRPEQAFALFKAADAIDAEFGLFLRVLCYTGMRLCEALGIELRQLDLGAASIHLPDTKNGEARSVYLPPVLIAALSNQPPRPGRRGGRERDHPGIPFLERPPGSRLFRFHAGGHLRDMLAMAMQSGGLTFPRRQRGFHLLCHTYGTWMHRYGGLDNFGLTRTERWADPRSAERYLHTEVSEEARRAAWLPTETKKRAKRVQRDK